ncbi:hypothetical protein BX616_009573, partial [Lobosporangium transversale]
IKVDFSRSPTGHIMSCSCHYFFMNHTCCKHIALAQLEYHPVTFFRVDQWEHESKFQPGMLEPLEEEHSANPTPDVDHIAIYIQRLTLLEELRDKNADFPQRKQIERDL